MSRSIANCLLCALLVWGGMPFATAGGTQRAACRMACCTRGAPSSSAAMKAMKATTAMPAMHAMHQAPSRAAAQPASPPPCCTCGGARGPQQAGVPGGNPSVLPAPPRLPAPLGASLAGRQPGPPLELPCLDLPERPPRA